MTLLASIVLTLWLQQPVALPSRCPVVSVATARIVLVLVVPIPTAPAVDLRKV